MDQHRDEQGNQQRKDSEVPAADQPHADGEEPIEEVEAEVEGRNPDPVTKREAFEREAAERGRSEDAREVGQEVD